MIRTDLSKSITQFLDRQFIDPSVAAVTGVSPGSITNGITAITPTGVNMAAFRADVKTLLNSLLDDNQSLAGAYWIMTQQQAVALSLAQNSLGQIIYPGINAEGGTLLGYPVLTTENIPATGGSPADGYPLIFAIGPEILLADDGQVTIDVSREASVQMDGAPDSPPTASTNMQSLWQLNQIGHQGRAVHHLGSTPQHSGCLDTECEICRVSTDAQLTGDQRRSPPPRLLVAHFLGTRTCRWCARSTSWSGHQRGRRIPGQRYRGAHPHRA